MNESDDRVNGSTLKRIVRKMARAVYRAISPVARPVAFRIRHYLLTEVYSEIRTMRQELLHEIRHATAINSEVLVKTAQSVQHEVLVHSHHWYLEGQKDFQGVAADLHQAVQASRESLRDEMQRLAMHTIAGVAGAHQLEAHSASIYERLDRIESLGHVSARRMAIHCEAGTIMVKTAVGYVLCADSDHAVLACLVETGELEFGTRVLIERFLKPGDVFVDVGAHLGLMSLAAAGALKGRGHIFAFEPFPQTRALLEKSFWVNGLSPMITVRGAAVSDQRGERTLHLGLNSGHHSLFELDLPSGHVSQQIKVDVVTLDDALPVGQHVSLIKIDAEGAETDIIRGAKQLEANNPDMAYIVEFGPSHLKRTGHDIEDWLQAFTEIGLSYKAINLETGALETVSIEQLASVDSVNLFFARPGSSAWAKGGAHA